MSLQDVTIQSTSAPGDSITLNPTTDVLRIVPNGPNRYCRITTNNATLSNILVYNNSTNQMYVRNGDNTRNTLILQGWGRGFISFLAVGSNPTYMGSPLLRCTTDD